MAGLIRRSDIDEVRSRTNIADVVGDYVTLKRAGIDSMKGLCPFHDERTPSFHVRPQAGRYHCFGCGEGGDVFSFLEKLDHLSFQEAVERLAGRIGYQLHYEDGASASEHGNRSRLLAANRAAEEFFAAHLLAAEAEPGRRFLGERGFDQAAAERFGVGFAPKSFDALNTHLRSRGFSDQELLAAGLVGEGERGLYDRFRGRVIWPIRDTTGQTLGFGARRVLEDDQGPKYLNTPETPVYHKGQVLYGLDLAKRDIARGKQVVIVEGYTDVMACHLAGVTTAIATCGTAFGVEHIKVVRRVLGDAEEGVPGARGEVIFTFDPDEAGQKAASRAFAEEQRFAAQTFVAVASDGLDPCDLRLKRGDDAVRRLVQQRRPMFEFMLRRVLDAHDLETVEGRVGALREAAPIVAGIRDPALGSGYVRNLAGWLGMDLAEVGRAVKSVLSARGRDGGSAEIARPAQVAPSLVQLPSDPNTRLERDALMAILQHPELVGRELAERAAFVAFANQSLAIVRDGVAASLDAFGSPQWLSRVTDQVPQPFASLVQQLGVAPIPGDPEQLDVYCRGVVSHLLERELLRRKVELLGALQRTDAAADPERHRAIQHELVTIEADRRVLRPE